MSMIVYQGLPQVNESRALRLKLPSPRAHIPHSLEMAICTVVLDSDTKTLFKENGEMIIRQKFSNPSSEPTPKLLQDSLQSLSFIQTLPNVTHHMTSHEWRTNRASSVLSDKSLELCTENLGSETGTDVLEEDDTIFSNDFSSRKIHSRRMNVSSCRRMSCKNTFPPPLSTRMGLEKVQVRHVRENGRLVLQAVKVQPKLSCFQADRSNGRLRLRLVHADSSSESDSKFKIIEK